MKYRALQFIVALLGGLALMLALVLLVGRVAPVRADPGVLYVAPGGNCNGASPCHGSVQVAVDAAAPGDEIRVAAGTYTGVSVRPAPPGYPWTPASGTITQAVYITKTVMLRGGYTTTNGFADPPNPVSNPVIVDAQGQGRVLFIHGDISSTVEGLHITGGNADGLGGMYKPRAPAIHAGGGVYVMTATITLSKCWVYSNTSSWGGGLFLHTSSNAILSSNTISDNIGGGGGGMYLNESIVDLSDNTIASNNANNGGGMWVYRGKITLSHNTIYNNQATGWGGGVALGATDATLDDNIVISNTAGIGGGLHLVQSDATLINTVVADNHANTRGSGLHIWGSSPRLLHTTVARNTGGDGSGIYVTELEEYSTVSLTNTILAGHSVGISVTGGNTATVNGVLWHNTPITTSQSVTATVMVKNQYTGDPTFASDGYHLTSRSAAIDAGVNAGVESDIDGESRPIGLPDLGADEWNMKVYLPLVLHNY